ncbi:MAG: hypothetical protein K1X95_08140 [Acidimicrobiia bacterium]|nr:hypothetical protein [Acidimicrobiia bacterium]
MTPQRKARSRDWDQIEMEIARALDLLEEGQFVIVEATVAGPPVEAVAFVQCS